MEVGEVRAAVRSDFDRLISLASSDSPGWMLSAKKSSCSVYTCTNEICNFKMVKIIVDSVDVAASTMYNALHDAAYRRVWDKEMVESREVCVIDSNNDIGYYQGNFYLLRFDQFIF
ncbi:hypothetical protein EB796_019182 [Bugula neritina]|uniref:START domain-containing protein n=1 Tax=Bugula neritina TaxID=10212 RepID=A0A7J7JAV7_BUGNE|nr:hypothetical protein EB796_019182 [Bugula neritina]